MREIYQNLGERARRFLPGQFWQTIFNAAELASEEFENLSTVTGAGSLHSRRFAVPAALFAAAQNGFVGR